MDNIKKDDLGNEIVEDVKPLDKPSKQDKINMLKDMIELYDNLPAAAMTAYPTNYDFYSLMLLLLSILQDD